MSTTDAALKSEIRSLAEEAFHRHLISGYGDSEYADRFQIVYKGKPRHLPLQKSRRFLNSLMEHSTQQ